MNDRPAFYGGIFYFLRARGWNPRPENPEPEADWDRTPHAFYEKPAKRCGDVGWDGDPESCALCWKTPGHPIHTDTGKAERDRMGLPDGWRPWGQNIAVLDHKTGITVYIERPEDAVRYIEENRGR